MSLIVETRRSTDSTVRHFRMEWTEFLRNIQTIANASREIGDSWELVKVNDSPCGTYLRKKFRKELSLSVCPSSHDSPFEEDATVGHSSALAAESNEYKQLLSFEFHVLYHLSYAVPFICFNVHKPNGSMITLDEAWQMFNDPIHGAGSRDKMEMTSVLTQTEHPIEFKPFLTLHPCRTAELLAHLPDSGNKVLSFLSAIGPAVHLSLDLRYAGAK